MIMICLSHTHILTKHMRYELPFSSTLGKGRAKFKLTLGKNTPLKPPQALCSPVLYTPQGSFVLPLRSLPI